MEFDGFEIQENKYIYKVINAEDGGNLDTLIVLVWVIQVQWLRTNIVNYVEEQ